MKFSTVTVIGANGSMGRNISAIFASFGNAKVYMTSRNIEDSKKAVSIAAKSVKSDSIVNKLYPVDYSSLEKCLSESDLIFDSVAENFSIKKQINEKISKYIKKGSIICSGSSGLNLSELALTLPEELREYYLGVHFFNPPYQMTLCELIPTKYTNKDLVSDMENYLSSVLYRTTVKSKNCPAFIGNRIGFYFINEALQSAEKYCDNGGIDYIDSILGPFTGRSMAPLVTTDFVGLDIHKAIVDNLFDNTNDYVNNSFVLPDYVEELIAEKKFGKKSGSGLYKKEIYNDVKINKVYDIKSKNYRNIIDYKFPFKLQMISYINQGDYIKAIESLIENNSLESKICISFLLKYILYGLYISLEVGDSIYAADDVMATGFNWCPPLALKELFDKVVDFKLLVTNNLGKEYLDYINFDYINSQIKPSKYDYRRFIRALG